MDDRCTRSNKDGSPCNARPWRDGKCRWHHPDSQAAIAEGRRKGGANKSSQARAKKAAAGMTATDIDGLLATAMKDVLAGTITPGQAVAAATVAKALLTVRESAALERFEERLSHLERTSARGWSA